MASITLEHLTFRYQPDHDAVHDVCLQVIDGQRLALVGPSGAGKTTLLRLIAGLQQPASGRILLGDQEITAEDPSCRRISMIFQDAALFPHTRVRENISYGLSRLGYGRTQIAQKVTETAQMLKIEPLLDRYPGALSGGERQRVGIARALIRDPQVLLLDEPFSSLDLRLKEQMKDEILQLQKRLNMTMIIVTHDQAEAMSFGQQIAVIHQGKLLECGTPEQLYDHPQTVFTAGFIGQPEMNFLPAHWDAAAGFLQLRLGGASLDVPVSLTVQPSSCDLLVGVRPHDLAGAGQPAAGIVIASSLAGSQSEARVQCGSQVLRLLSAQRLPVGAPVTLYFNAPTLHLFDPVSGRALK